MYTFTPADFSIAYLYLEELESENATVDWDLIKHTSLYADLLLLRVMHKVMKDRPDYKSRDY